MNTPIEQTLADVARAQLVEDMTNAFLIWPLPESVCADPCASKQQPGRVGSNLLSYGEAKAMILTVVIPRLPK